MEASDLGETRSYPSRTGQLLWQEFTIDSLV